jgi:hypothetical protein
VLCLIHLTHTSSFLPRSHSWLVRHFGAHCEGFQHFASGLCCSPLSPSPPTSRSITSISLYHLICFVDCLRCPCLHPHPILFRPFTPPHPLLPRYFLCPPLLSDVSHSIIALAVSHICHRLHNVYAHPIIEETYPCTRPVPRMHSIACITATTPSLCVQLLQCPHITSNIRTGICQRNALGKVILLSGLFVPHHILSSNLHTCIAEYHHQSTTAAASTASIAPAIVPAFIP